MRRGSAQKDARESTTVALLEMSNPRFGPKTIPLKREPPGHEQASFESKYDRWPRGILVYFSRLLKRNPRPLWQQKQAFCWVKTETTKPRSENE